MFRLITTYFFIGFSLNLYAQKIIVIKDKQTSAPLAGAILHSSQPPISVVSNNAGEVDISPLSQAESITISLLGYTTVTTTYKELASISDFELTMLATPFEAVVISAVRWSQSAAQVPSKISFIKSKDITLQNPQTMADALGHTGEVFIQKSQQGGGSPMIRGFATNRLFYSIDGIRMNTAIFRGGNIQNVISLDALAMQNIEVLFGTASVMYGSDAIGGIMSFQTLAPQLSATTQAQAKGNAFARYASANQENTLHFDLNLGQKKWASVTSITYSHFSDLTMGKHGKDEYLKTFFVQRIDNVDRVVQNPKPLVQNPSGYSQLNLMQKVKFSPKPAWEFEYAFHYSATSDYARYDRLIERQANGLPTSAVWQYGPQIWTMHLLTMQHNAPTLFYDRANLKIAYQYFEESRIDRRFNHHRLRTNTEKVGAYTANYDFEKNIGKNTLHYGVEYVLNQVNSVGSAVDIRNNSPLAVASRYPNALWQSYAFYLHYQNKISEKLVLQAGARYNFFSLASDFSQNLAFFPFDFKQNYIQNSAFTYSLGGVFSPNPTWKISTQFSTGFRSPNVDDIGKIFDFVQGEVVVPNPTLRAEYAYNAEVGIAKVIANILKLDITGFYTYLDRAMVRRAFSVGGQDSIFYDGIKSKVFAIQNAAYGRVYGLQAGAELLLDSGLGFSLKYNYQLGKEQMDNGEMSRSRHAAPAFGVGRLFYQKDKLSMQIYAVYSGEVSFAHLNLEERSKVAIYARDSQGNPFSPSWYTFNYKCAYQLTPQLSLSVGVENIGDHRYRPYSWGLVAAGRNVIFALRSVF